MTLFFFVDHKLFGQCLPGILRGSFLLLWVTPLLLFPSPFICLSMHKIDVRVLENNTNYLKGAEKKEGKQKKRRSW